ncbi:hypothetical protein Tsubulata_021726 [Turnera subulata]|uniref:B box-type domain-containing protein n=1 Tax=Turnera subulata TaxID=218843 RepID=A0A9Q0FQH4_9ROSI|nr:hypothetical protein Tsubulata_021726 [Turnera subulata]
MEQEQQQQQQQQLLNLLLETTFFETCEKHIAKYCNFLCRDCKGPAFCESCKNEHEGHGVLQMYKNLSHTGVRVDDIKDLVDISEIQTYRLNNHPTIYINERPQRKGKPLIRQGKRNSCEKCGRKMEIEDQNKSRRFCSIECKLDIKPDNLLS